MILSFSPQWIYLQIFCLIFIFTLNVISEINENTQKPIKYCNEWNWSLIKLPAASALFCLSLSVPLSPTLFHTAWQQFACHCEASTAETVITNEKLPNLLREQCERERGRGESETDRDRQQKLTSGDRRWTTGTAGDEAEAAACVSCLSWGVTFPPPSLSLSLSPFLLLCSAVATGAMLLLRCLLLFCFWLFLAVILLAVSDKHFNRRTNNFQSIFRRTLCVKRA